MAERKGANSGLGTAGSGVLVASLSFLIWYVQAKLAWYSTAGLALGALLVVAGLLAAGGALREFLRVYWLTLVYVAFAVVAVILPESWVDVLPVGIPVIVRLIWFLALVAIATLIFNSLRARGELEDDRAAASGNAALLVILAMWVLGLLNFLAAGPVGSQIGSVDTTETRVFTLGEKTRRLLDGLRDLPGKVHAVYLNTGSNYRPDYTGEEPLGDRGQDFLRLYGEYSDRVEVKVFSALREKEKVREHLEELGIEEPEVGMEDTVIFAYREKPGEAPRRKDVTVSRWTFLETTPLGTRKFKGEQLFTSAIQDVIFPRRNVYVLKGHGELPLFGGPVNLREAEEVIRRLALDVQELDLSEKGRVPPDADLVLIARPRSSLLPGEVKALVEYLDAGGSLLLLLDPQGNLRSAGAQPVKTGLEDYLSRLGVTPRTDVLCMDFELAWGATQAVPLKTALISQPDYSSHAIVSDLSERGLACAFPEASPILTEDPEDGTDAKVESEGLIFLRRSTPELGLETYGARLYPGRDVDAVDRRNDLTGQRLPIAAVAERRVEPPAPPEDPSGEAAPKPVVTRVAVFGDSDFASTLGLSQRSRFYSPAHATLLSNVVSWAVERESLIAIEAKTLETETVVLADEEERLARAVGVFGIPWLVLVSGVAIALRRRR